MRDNPFKYKLERTRRYKIRIKFCNRTSSISYLTIKKAAIEARSGKDPITDFCPLCSFKIVDKFNNRIVYNSDDFIIQSRWDLLDIWGD